MGMSVPPPENRSPHMIGVRIAESTGLSEDDLKLASAELVKRGVHVSIRGTAVRISPNVWNTMEDMDRLFDELETLLPSPPSAAL
jgi:selenocysteine lyase/cysteine desulfurase